MHLRPSGLKTEALCFSKTLVSVYKTQDVSTPKTNPDTEESHFANTRYLVGVNLVNTAVTVDYMFFYCASASIIIKLKRRFKSQLSFVNSHETLMVA
jgi:hypothetical protein